MMTLFSVHPQRETAGEMLEEVHKGLHPINALKVAIDHCLLGVAIHTERQTAAYVDHVNEGLVNARPNKRTCRRNAKVCRKSIIHLDNKLNLSPDDVIHQRDRCAGIQVTSTAVTYKRPNITL